MQQQEQAKQTRSRSRSRFVPLQPLLLKLFVHESNQTPPI